MILYNITQWLINIQKNYNYWLVCLWSVIVYQNRQLVNNKGSASISHLVCG